MSPQKLGFLIFPVPVIPLLTHTWIQVLLILHQKPVVPFCHHPIIGPITSLHLPLELTNGFCCVTRHCFTTKARGVGLVEAPAEGRGHRPFHVGGGGLSCFPFSGHLLSCLPLECPLSVPSMQHFPAAPFLLPPSLTLRF